MVAFLGDCELAHLAPSLIELKYITPQDLVDAGDDELLSVLSRLRYRMAPPERRRFVRTVVAVKHEAGVHTALTLESVQVLGHGSVIADLKAERRSLELAPNEVHEGEPDSMHFLGEPEPEPEPEQSRFNADRSGEHTAETRVPAYRPGDLETFLDGLREARANNPSAAAVPAVAAPAGVANICVPSETSAAIAAAVAISRSTQHSQDKAKRRNSAYDAAHILAQVSTDKMFWHNDYCKPWIPQCHADLFVALVHIHLAVLVSQAAGDESGMPVSDPTAAKAKEAEEAKAAEAAKAKKAEEAKAGEAAKAKEAEDAPHAAAPQATGDSDADMPEGLNKMEQMKWTREQKAKAKS
jgi:hypothetical protein